MESKAPLDVSVLFNKYNLANIHDNMRASLLKVENKIVVKSMIETIIDEKLEDYLTAVQLSLPKAVHESLGIEKDGALDFIELPEAHYRSVISNS